MERDHPRKTKDIFVGTASGIPPQPDGTDVAGAIIGPDTLERAAEKGLDGAASLADNDAGGFFEALGDAVICGPTRTNVNDLRAILVN